MFCRSGGDWRVIFTSWADKHHSYDWPHRRLLWSHWHFLCKSDECEHASGWESGPRHVMNDALGDSMNCHDAETQLIFTADHLNNRCVECMKLWWSREVHCFVSIQPICHDFGKWYTNDLLMVHLGEWSEEYYKQRGEYEKLYKRVGNKRRKDPSLNWTAKPNHDSWSNCCASTSLQVYWIHVSVIRQCLSWGNLNGISPCLE